jgi:hypothetical protein
MAITKLDKTTGEKLDYRLVLWSNKPHLKLIKFFGFTVVIYS